MALVAGAAGITVAVLLLRSQPGPVSSGGAAAIPPATATTTIEGGGIPTPTSPGYPSPPPGAVVLAREAGTRALALAVVPDSPTSLVRVSVLDGQGAGETGLDVAIRAGGKTTELPGCAPGCYQAHVESSTLSGRVAVVLDNASFEFTLPDSLDLEDGTATMARATSVWRKLKSLVWHERLASSATDALYTVYKVVAPDRLAYTIRGESSAIIIGTKRWDRTQGAARWVESPQLPPIHQPAPFWASVSDARVLGSGSAGGRSVWIVSFFDGLTPAWFEAEVEKSTGRTIVLEMIAVAHFMHHVYGPFDAPIQVTPPAA